MRRSLMSEPLRMQMLVFFMASAEFMMGFWSKERMFAKEVLGSQHMENLLLSLAGQFVYFHFSAVDDVEIVSRITRGKDDLAFIVVPVYGF